VNDINISILRERCEAILIIEHLNPNSFFSCSFSMTDMPGIKTIEWCAQFWANLNIECKNESAADLYHLVLLGKECEMQLTVGNDEKPFEEQLLALWILKKKIDKKSVYVRSTSPKGNWRMLGDVLDVSLGDDMVLVPSNLKEFAYRVFQYKQKHDNKPGFNLNVRYGSGFERDRSRDISTNSLEKIREWSDRVDELAIENVLWRLYSNGEEYAQAAELLGRELTKDEIKVVKNLLHEYSNFDAQVSKHQNWESFLENANYHTFEDYGIKEKMDIMDEFIRFGTVGDDSDYESD
jgi:hypothetical protein